MATVPFSKLARMTIRAHDVIDFLKGEGNVVSTYKAQYNPATFSLSRSIGNQDKYMINPSSIGGDQTTQKRNGIFSVEFFIDGTGASPSGGILPGAIGSIAGLFENTVNKEIDKFKETAFQTVVSTHEPACLVITYGSALRFACKIESATFNYTLFDRAGNPLRASINATFKQIQDVGDDKETKVNTESADITKLYTVTAGDTIYNIANREYDNESYYLKIAEVNNLKNYRNLVPGQQLILPSVKQS